MYVMRLSKLFTKTRREAPSDETSKNAQLLIRGGFINKEMAGVYDYLPLGLRVIKNIEEIIRKEMNSVGGQEVLMSSLQRSEIWKTTNRWENIDSWFKTQLKEGGDLGMAFTHEEPITQMMEQFVLSYKDLPVYVYQFQNKFRNEARAKSGIMRTREFIMKDLYSFSKSQEEHQRFYDQVTDAYKRIFEKVGIGHITYLTRASGGSFSKFSHEFQTLSEAGEDTIYLNPDIGVAINSEIIDEPTAFENIDADRSTFKERKSIEVGNIFSLGTKFSEPLLCRFKKEDGEVENPIMGSYGIGLGRLMGTIAEVLSDEKGLVWPDSVAPFLHHLVEIPSNDPKVKETALRIYEKLKDSTLYDDRDARAGEKFADADLIGIPYQVIVSEKNLLDGKLELKNRRTGEVSYSTEEELLK